MSRNHIQLDATPEAVFDVLLDPWTYPNWVVGAKRIRSVDAEWPTPGSKFHHSVGTGPATISDSSQLIDLKAPECLTLEVRFRPVGVGTVTFEVERLDAGCVVTMTEEPTSGPLWYFWNVLIDAGVQLRNEMTLRRLRGEVERRARR